MPGFVYGDILYVLLETAYSNVTVDLRYKTLKHFARTEFYEFCSAVGNHIAYRLSPAYRSSELSDKICLDFGDRKSVV